MMRRTIFLIVILLLLEGCAFRKADLKSKRRPLYRSATLEQLVDRLSDGEAGVSNIKANFTALLTDLGSGKKESCSGVLAMGRPDRLRMKASKAMLPTFFDLLCVGQKVTLYLPRDRTVYQGNTSSNTAGPAIPELGILTSLLWGQREDRGTVNFLESHESRYIIYTVEQKPETTRLIKKVVFDRLNLQPIRYQYFNRRGELVRDIACSDFFSAKESIAPLPRQISIMAPLEKKRIALRLRNIRLNSQLNPDLFRIKLPPSFRLRPLEECFK